MNIPSLWHPKQKSDAENGVGNDDSPVLSFENRLIRSNVMAKGTSNRDKEYRYEIIRIRLLVFPGAHKCTLVAIESSTLHVLAVSGNSIDFAAPATDTCSVHSN